MSLNLNPEWTKDLSLPDKSQMTCPTCKKVAFNASTVMECLYNPTFYAARHIPPELIFTCGNENCPNCYGDFSVKLSLTVVIVKKD